MKHRHPRRPCRWAVAVGIPGQPPSREAMRLAAAQPVLPPGCWHLSDHAVDLVAAGPTDVIDATHASTGARFRLLTHADGRVLGMSAEDAAAQALAPEFWSDPTKWAQQQDWWVTPPERKQA